MTTPRRRLLLLALAGLLLPSMRPSRAFGEEAAPDAPGAPAAPGADDGPTPEDDHADDEVPFVEEVNAAIEQGTRWLLARPKLFTTAKVQVAHWGLIDAPTLYGGGTGPGYGHPAGPTAFALYTLLKCGVPANHPTVVEGFRWLQVNHPITKEYDGDGAPAGFSWSHSDKNVAGSYEVSAMVLALCAKYDVWKRGKATTAAARAGKLRIKDPKDLEWLQNLVSQLVVRRGVPVAGAKPADRLGWRYNVPEVTVSRGRTTSKRGSNPGVHGNQDLSSTQLAALALFSARRFGVEVKPDVWFDVVAFTLSQQETEGPEHERHDPGYKPDRYAKQVLKDHARGFMYLRGSPDRSEGVATGSMTACGVANLLMARDVLLAEPGAKTEWAKRGYDKAVDKAIWDGLAWLDLNWSAFSNAYTQVGYHTYYLYALERAMDLLGKNLVGTHTWYPDGARELLNRLQRTKVKVRAEKGAEQDAVFWNTNSTHDPKDVLDTCFALLFLKRATRDMIPTPPTLTGGE
jgi:hypothetical protein